MRLHNQKAQEFVVFTSAIRKNYWSFDFSGNYERNLKIWRKKIARNYSKVTAETHLAHFTSVIPVNSHAILLRESLIIKIIIAIMTWHKLERASEKQRAVLYARSQFPRTSAAH